MTAVTSRKLSFLATLLIALIIGSVLYAAQAAFIPVALALLFSLLLSSPVETLHKLGLPRGASAFIVVLAFLTPIALAINLLKAPAQHWLEIAPRTVRIIERKMIPVTQVVSQVDSLVTRVGRLGNGAGPATTASSAGGTPAPVRVTDSGGLLVETQILMVGLATTVILTLFLLAGGPPMLARMATALASYQQASQVLDVVRAVRIEVARYYGTIALINLGLGIATALMAFAFGIPNPALWGVLAAVLNFLPYVGSAIMLIVLGLVAFMTFEGLGPVLGVVGSYLALATIEGQLVQPLFVGKRLELNPPIVFLTLWFGGWFWGTAGIIVAIPALVALKVAAEHHRHGAAIAAFLSPGVTRRAYQRGLTARDALKKI